MEMISWKVKRRASEYFNWQLKRNYLNRYITTLRWIPDYVTTTFDDSGDKTGDDNKLNVELL